MAVFEKVQEIIVEELGKETDEVKLAPRTYKLPWVRCLSGSRGIYITQNLTVEIF